MESGEVGVLMVHAVVVVEEVRRRLQGCVITPNLSTRVARTVQVNPAEAVTATLHSPTRVLKMASTENGQHGANVPTHVEVEQ